MAGGSLTIDYGGVNSGRITLLVWRPQAAASCTLVMQKRCRQEFMRTRSGLPKALMAALLAGMVAAVAVACAAADEPGGRARQAAPSASLYLKVQLPKSAKVSALKAGDMIEGTLARDVYAADREVYAAGSTVKLRVGRVEKRRRRRNDRWPWVVRAFTPRHEKYPVFTDARISTAGGNAAELQVSMGSISRKTEVHAQTRKGSAAGEKGSIETSKSHAAAGLTMILEADAPTVPSDTNGGASSAAAALPEAFTLPSGTRCKILLLGDISASKSQAGDTVQARLLEPVRLDSHVVLPAGSIFEGSVVKGNPAALDEPGS